MNVNPTTSRKIPKYLTLGNFDSRPGNHEVSAWSFGQNGQNVQPCHRDPVQISRQMCWQEFTKGQFFSSKTQSWFLCPLISVDSQKSSDCAALEVGFFSSWARVTEKTLRCRQILGMHSEEKGGVMHLYGCQQMYCLVMVYDIHCIMHQCNAWEKGSEYKQLSQERMCFLSQWTTSTTYLWIGSSIKN